MEKQYRKPHSHSMRAFTISELLITIAIIGVIAAMTMPTLMANIQSKTLDTSVKVSTRKIMAAVETMTNLDKMGGYNDTADFVNHLRKHLNIVQVCKPDEILPCWNGSDETSLPEAIGGDVLFNMGNLDPSGRRADYGSNVVSFVLADGASVIMSYNTLCRADGHEPRNCIVAAFDTNGSRRPNHFGQDIFLINSKFFNDKMFDDSIDVSPERGSEVEVSGMCNGTGSCGNNGHGGGGGHGDGPDGHDGNN